MKLNEFDLWLNEVEENSEDIPNDLKTEVKTCVMDRIHSDFPCTNEEKDSWINNIENNVQDALPDELKARVIENVLTAIHQQELNGIDIRNNLFVPEIEEIDVDDVLLNFNPNPKVTNHNSANSRRFIKKRNKVKAAAIIILCIAGLSISGATYAAISGRLSGVFRTTPELTEQLDHPNPVQQPLDSVSPIVIEKDPSRFDNSKIISASSFEDDHFFNSATDVKLQNIGNGTYAGSEFIYDTNDIAVFTKDNGESWSLKANESLQITIAIDTSFAASEARGEDMSLAYVKDGKFVEFGLKRITDEPNSFSFTAPEDGNYYLATVNASFSYLKVTTLEIQ